MRHKNKSVSVFRRNPILPLAAYVGYAVFSALQCPAAAAAGTSRAIVKHRVFSASLPCSQCCIRLLVFPCVEFQNFRPSAEPRGQQDYNYKMLLLETLTVASYIQPVCFHVKYGTVSRIFLAHLAASHVQMRPIATVVTRSMVRLSVCLSVS